MGRCLLAVRQQLVREEACKFKNLFLYEPLVTEEQCLHAESETFLTRFFGGSVRPLLVHFARKRKLTRAEIEELKRILEKGEES